uniref:Ribosomal protein S13 n=1 Tax=Proteomonas sulcata TaxID=77928 RepID=A0A2P1G8C8_9CRYP|nr:ribosomal protein S13 [Proteomonas sulcata]AVM81214.1 ribosomal protein S13 [Proteomonas sulcata]
MVQILGNTLENKKKVYIALTKIYGLNKYQTLFLCNKLNIGKDCKVKDLNQNYFVKLIKLIEQNNLIVENNLRQKYRSDITNLINIKCYRGIRHIQKTLNRR